VSGPSTPTIRDRLVGSDRMFTHVRVVATIHVESAAGERWPAARAGRSGTATGAASACGMPVGSEGNGVGFALRLLSAAGLAPTVTPLSTSACEALAGAAASTGGPEPNAGAGVEPPYWRIPHAPPMSATAAMLTHAYGDTRCAGTDVLHHRQAPRRRG
jgi:hypothetical protein